MNKVVILARKGKNKRWNNIEEIKYVDELDIVIIYPELLGPVGLKNELEGLNPEIIMSAIGSASYQLFFMELKATILILRGNFQKVSTWEEACIRDGKDSLYEMRPFTGRTWLVYRESEKNDSWNMDFEYTKKEITDIVKAVREKKKIIPKTNIRLLSPKEWSI